MCGRSVKKLGAILVYVFRPLFIQTGSALGLHAAHTPYLANIELLYLYDCLFTPILALNPTISTKVEADPALITLLESAIEFASHEVKTTLIL